MVFAQTSTRPCGPTATEIFHLRFECGALGKRKAEENQHPKYSVGYTAHYDPQANRCYIRLQSALRSNSEGRILIMLVDGQSNEVMATASSYWEKLATGKLETGEDGEIGESSPASGDAAYLKAKAFIDDHMREK
jgi:hypothetical protein